MYEKTEIRFVNKDITPFDGLSLFMKMLERCRFEDALNGVGMPAQGSNRGYDPVRLVYGLFAGVWCGANCYEHLDLVRYDSALCQLIGWDKGGAGYRAYQRYFGKFSHAVNQRVFSSLYKWFFSRLGFDNYTLGFDSTVMTREGAEKGYNPKRPGRNSHHPLLAFVSDVRMIANYWLRPGNTSATTNYLSFLADTLDRLEGKKVGLVRMDSGFFSKEIMDELETRGLRYIIACRFNNRIKCALASQGKWVNVCDGLDIAESTYHADGWEKPRRIVMVRQDTEKRAKAEGKKILKAKQLELFGDVEDFGKYRYSCLVTNLDLPAKAVYDTYRGRADSENRIKELKHDFWATEACGNFIVMAYNFLSLFRHALINSPKRKFLKTIRYELISIPAYIKKKDDRNILYLARKLKTRESFIGIWEDIDYFELPYSM